MKCPDCEGKGKISEPLDMRTMGEKRCDSCGGTGELAADEGSLEAKLDLVIEQQQGIRDAITYIQIQNRSLFYRPDLHGRLVYEFKEPFKKGLKKFRAPGAGMIAKAKALRQMWKAFKSIRSLPKPTAGNVGQPNSRILCNIRDYFFSHVQGFPWLKELELVADAFIIVYDTDFYRQFINVWVDALRDAEGWIPNGPNAPDGHYWKHDK